MASAWNQDASGTPVLALHGFTGSGLDWAPIAHRLRRPLLAPDLLGHGSSPAPTDVELYRMERVVEHCESWCEDTPIVDVIGYSMGGRVALRLATVLGPRLRRLVLVSTSPGEEDPQLRSERMAQDYALAGTIEALGMDWFSKHWADQPIIRSQRNIPPEIRASMSARRTNNRVAGLAGSLRGMGQGAVRPVWSNIADIQAPVLLLTGDLDQRYTRIAESMVSALPNGEHARIPVVGHCVHLESLDVVVNHLDMFLAVSG